jgi:hypothetical protein
MDLSNVVPSVSEMESAPLMNTERTKNAVTGDTTGAKEYFGLIAELIHRRETGGDLLGEFFA